MNTAFLLAASALTSIPLIDVDPVLTDGFQEFFPGGLSGFSFTATQEFEVTALGLFDERQDGIGSYAVALNQGECPLSCSRVLVAFVSEQDPLSGVWRVHDINPQTLPADEYLVLYNAPTGRNVADPVWFVNDFSAPIAQGFQLGAPAIEDTFNGFGEVCPFPPFCFGLDVPDVTDVTFILVEGALLGPNVFITPVPELGDCNRDGILDASDLSCVDTRPERDAVLGALKTLAGDLDGNGDVSFADFLVLSGNFGQNSLSYTDGNVDLQDGIDFADFLVLSANFGKSAATGAAKPEPGAATLFVVGLFCLVGRRSIVSETRARRETRHPTIGLGTNKSLHRQELQETVGARLIGRAVIPTLFW